MEKPYLSVRNPLTLPDSRHLVEIFLFIIGGVPPLATSCYPLFPISFSICLFFSSSVLSSPVLLQSFHTLLFLIQIIILFFCFFLVPNRTIMHSRHERVTFCVCVCVCGVGGLLGKKLFEEFYCCPLQYLVIATSKLPTFSKASVR
jgi:hypothetical protein